MYSHFALEEKASSLRFRGTRQQLKPYGFDDGAGLAYTYYTGLRNGVNIVSIINKYRNEKKKPPEEK